MVNIFLGLFFFMAIFKTYAWQDYRVIECPSEQQCESQAEIFKDDQKGFKERKLKIELNKNYEVFRLIGLDGGLKKSSQKPFEKEALYSLIDSMPMRQAEMRQD